MSGSKKLRYPCVWWTVTVLTGFTVGSAGCSSLSQPGAGDRLKGLLGLSADQPVQAQRMYDADQYSDGLTPQQRLDACYRQTESQLDLKAAP